MNFKKNDTVANLWDAYVSDMYLKRTYMSCITCDTALMTQSVASINWWSSYRCLGCCSSSSTLTSTRQDDHFLSGQIVLKLQNNTQVTFYIHALCIRSSVVIYAYYLFQIKALRIYDSHWSCALQLCLMCQTSSGNVILCIMIDQSLLCVKHIIYI